MEGIEALPASAWNFIDVGLFVEIAIYIRKLSRIAAVCGLILYWLEQLYAFAISDWDPNRMAGIWMMVLFSCAFINGIRGTFAYHRLTRSS